MRAREQTATDLLPLQQKTSKTDKKMKNTVRRVLSGITSGQETLKTLCAVQGKLTRFSTDEQQGEIEVVEVAVKLPIHKKNEDLSKTSKNAWKEGNESEPSTKPLFCRILRNVPSALRLVEFSTRNLFPSSSLLSQGQSSDYFWENKIVCSSTSCLYPSYLRTGIMLTAWLSADASTFSEVEKEAKKPRIFSSISNAGGESLTTRPTACGQCFMPVASCVLVKDSSFSSFFSSPSALMRISPHFAPLPHSHPCACSSSFFDSAPSYDVIRLELEEFLVWRGSYEKFHSKMRELIHRKYALEEAERVAVTTRRRLLERRAPIDERRNA